MIPLTLAARAAVICKAVGLCVNHIYLFQATPLASILSISFCMWLETAWHSSLSSESILRYTVFCFRYGYCDIAVLFGLQPDFDFIPAGFGKLEIIRELPSASQPQIFSAITAVPSLPLPVMLERLLMLPSNGLSDILSGFSFTPRCLLSCRQGLILCAFAVCPVCLQITDCSDYRVCYI
jgi:hypothetical protein